MWAIRYVKGAKPKRKQAASPTQVVKTEEQKWEKHVQNCICDGSAKNQVGLPKT